MHSFIDFLLESAESADIITERKMGILNTVFGAHSISIKRDLPKFKKYYTPEQLKDKDDKSKFHQQLDIDGKTLKDHVAKSDINSKVILDAKRNRMINARKSINGKAHEKLFKFESVNESIMNPEQFRNKEYVELKHEHTPKEYKQSLEKHYSFDDKDHKYIKNYTLASATMNEELARRAIGEKSKLTQSTIAAVDDQARGMRNVCTKHKLDHKFVTYSGVTQDPTHVMIHQGGHPKEHGGDGSGALVRTSNFTSSTINPYIAFDFAKDDEHSIYNHPNEYYNQPRHMLKLTYPEGHPGAYVDHHSSNPSEEEFVSPPGTKIHITHSTTHSIKGKRVVMHHGTVLPWEEPHNSPIPK